MKMNARPAASLLFLPLVAALAACGGGGGGGPGPVAEGERPDPAPIVTAPDVTISGPTETESITYSFDTGTQKFTSISAATAPSSGGVSTLGFTNAGTIVELTLDPGPDAGPLKFTGFGPSGVSPLLTLAENDTHVALVPSGIALKSEFLLGWNYQSFGVWEPGAETGTGTSGVVSFGTVTPVAAIPSTGTATYRGILGGQYVRADGVDHVLYSDLVATANFDARTIGLSTTRTLILNEADLAARDVSASLGLSGTLDITPGANAFSGTVTAGSMSGETTGRFYGPNADELGGVGTVQAGSGVESIQFAYGAKKLQFAYGAKKQ